MGDADGTNKQLNKQRRGGWPARRLVGLVGRARVVPPGIRCQGGGHGGIPLRNDRKSIFRNTNSNSEVRSNSVYFLGENFAELNTNPEI